MAEGSTTETSGTMEQKLRLLNDMLNLGDQILASDAAVESSEGILIRFRARTQLHEQLSELAMDGTTASLTGLVRDKANQVVEQNAKINSLLSSHKDLIRMRLDRLNDAMRLSRRYSSRRNQRHVPAGMRVDETV